MFETFTNNKAFLVLLNNFQYWMFILLCSFGSLVGNGSSIKKMRHTRTHTSLFDRQKECLIFACLSLQTELLRI